MSKRPTTDKEALERLRDALVEDILSASDAEIAADAASDSIDLLKQADQMRAMFHAQRLRAAKTKMAVAQAAVSGQRSASSLGLTLRPQAQALVPRPANDLGAARKLTMAARNGAKQSERDLAGVEEDLAELTALHDDEETKL